MESYHVKILTENGANFTNIDEARNYWFNSGMRDGISKGILNEGVFTTLESNVLYFDTCELRVGGHRFLLDQAYQYSFSSYPTVATRYALVATVVVDGVGNVTFTLGVQDAGISLVKDKLYKNLNGAGTYQVEIGRFTLTTNGTVEDVTRTIDIITGGKGSGDGAINIGNVTTHTLAAGLDAEVDVEQRLNQEDGKTYTDFNFDIPMGDKGDTGATGVGISTITAGTPTVSGGTTTTPITITLTNNTPIVVNIVAQNGTNGSNGASVTDVQVIYASTDASGNNIYNVTSTIGGSTVNSGTITAPKGDAGATPTIDSALSTTSENPVQNKVITNALGTKQDSLSATQLANIADVPNKANSSDIPTNYVTTDTNQTISGTKTFGHSHVLGSPAYKTRIGVGDGIVDLAGVQLGNNSVDRLAGVELDAYGLTLWSRGTASSSSAGNYQRPYIRIGDAYQQIATTNQIPTDYAKDDASNLTSANKDSWNTTLSNSKAYFANNVISEFTGTGATSKITGITTKESQSVTLNNDTLTIQKAGLYRILLSATVTGDNRTCELRIKRNGNSLDEIRTWTGFGNFQESVNSLCKLEVNDQITFEFTTDTSASYTIWRIKIMLWEV